MIFSFSKTKKKISTSHLSEKSSKVNIGVMQVAHVCKVEIMFPLFVLLRDTSCLVAW